MSLNKEKLFKKLELAYQLVYELEDEEPRLKKVRKAIDKAEAELELSEDRMNKLTQEVCDDLFPINWRV